MAITICVKCPLQQKENNNKDLKTNSNSILSFFIVQVHNEPKNSNILFQLYYRVTNLEQKKILKMESSRQKKTGKAKNDTEKNFWGRL